MDDRGRTTAGLPTKLNLCVLGLAFLVATDWCSDLTQSAALQGFEGIPALATRAASIAAFVLCATNLGHARDLASSKPVCTAVAGFLLAGQFAQAYAGAIPAASGAIAIVGAVLYGIAWVFLLLHWISLCCTLEPSEITLVFSLAYLAPGVTYFILAALSPMVTTFILCLLPAASALLLLLAHAGAAQQTAAVRPFADSGWTFPIYPVALMVIFKFVFYFSLSLTDGPSMYGPLGILLVATFAAVYATFFYERFHVSILYKMAPPCLVAGLLILAWVHLGASAATMISNAGNIAFELFIFVSLAEACRRFGIDPFWIFSIVEVASLASSFLGFQTGLMFTAAYPAGSYASNLLMMTIIVTLVALSTFLFNERMAGRAFGTEPVQPSTAEGASDDIPQHPSLAYDEELQRRCDKVAREYGLSRREVEILELLAQGMSAARIQEELVISRNTVKSHTRHIYDKLNVHS